MRHEPFSSYGLTRPSGIEWLADIPEHWEVKPLKRVAEMRLSNIDKLSVEGQSEVKLCNYVDVYKHEAITSDIEFMNATATAEQIRRLSLRRGDVIITKDSESPDDIGVPSVVRHEEPELVCGYHLALLRPNKVTDGEFLKWFLKSHFCRSSFAVSAKGLTRYGIGKDEITSQRVVSPPLREQQQIASFLNQETAKIDELITKQERLIALSQEKLRAYICNAVTNGLDRSAPVMDSGVEWLGQVPGHWLVTRVANHFSEVFEGGDVELPVLSVSIHHGVSDSEIDEEDMDRLVIRSEDRTKYKRVMPGDLVYNMMRAWQGGFGAVKVPGMVSPAYVVARPKVPLRSQFVEMVLRTPTAIEEIRRHSQGVTDFRLRLYWDEFKNLRLALPPIAEQDQILRCIDEESKRIKRLVEKARHSIVLMQERRSALISAAVTGKIDLREMVA